MNFVPVGGFLLVSVGLAQPSVSGGALKSNVVAGQALSADAARSSGSPSIQRVGGSQRPWIGVDIQKVEQDYAEALGLPDTSGALIIDVVDDGPAGAAGLAVGDVVIAVDGKRIEGPVELAKRIASIAPGAQAELTINRNGETLPVSIDVGVRPTQP